METVPRRALAVLVTAVALVLPLAAAPARAMPLPEGGRLPLAGVTVVVDPGHNGLNYRYPRIVNRIVYAGNGVWKACNTTGTATRAGYSEHAYTWSVATRLAAVLRARGARVVLTRPDDRGVGPCIDRRAAIGNAARATLVMSIHGDGSTAAGARGFHVISSTRMVGGTGVTAASGRLARVLRDAFRAGTGMPFANYTAGGDALAVRKDLGGLNLSTRPAVMIETGNMRNATDARLMSSPAFRQREAVALADGIQRYLGR